MNTKRVLLVLSIASFSFSVLAFDQMKLSEVYWPQQLETEKKVTPSRAPTQDGDSEEVKVEIPKKNHIRSME